VVTKHSFLVELDETAIIGIAVGAAAFVLIVVAIAIVFGVPKIRKSVFPHRDRATYTFKAT